jgi:release factor glutamine methyltransferase
MTTGRPATVAQAVAAAQAGGLARLDAQMLLLHALDRPTHDRAWLLAHDIDPLEGASARHFIELVQRRQAGEPVAYLTGLREFHGLSLQVDRRVLDPRADTETLVQWAIDALDPPASSPSLAGGQPRRHFIDLGTGSGAIALAVKHARPGTEVMAVDLSTDALAVASANAERLGLGVHFLQGSWLQSVNGRFDVMASNPPYIAAGDPHLAALIHEPLQALVSGADGLDDIRRIIQQAPDHLNPGGWLLLEHGWDQAVSVRNLLSRAGFERVQSRRDLAGIERCSGGQWPLVPQPPRAEAPGWRRPACAGSDSE